MWGERRSEFSSRFLEFKWGANVRFWGSGSVGKRRAGEVGPGGCGVKLEFSGRGGGDGALLCALCEYFTDEESANMRYQPSILVNAWNFSSWPGYKSRLWNKQAEQPSGRGSVSGASSSSAYQKR